MVWPGRMGVGVGSRKLPQAAGGGSSGSSACASGEADGLRAVCARTHSGQANPQGINSPHTIHLSVRRNIGRTITPDHRRRCLYQRYRLERVKRLNRKYEFARIQRLGKMERLKLRPVLQSTTHRRRTLAGSPFLHRSHTTTSSSAERLMTSSMRTSTRSRFTLIPKRRESTT